jgi:hypothetical protein
MNTPLGRLEKVDLRKAWLSESSGFTPWLAMADNLKLLGETIGIDLELQAQEKNVGPFRADILCKDTATDKLVLIENQLERTDHSHLGQLLTYSAGLDAVTIVWIAQRFTDEHRAALDWLNELTEKKINLFGLEIELWQIDTSPIAPKFNIISQPNDWTRTVQQAAEAVGLTEHKQLQLRFWTAFKDFMETHKSVVQCPKPAAQHWAPCKLGRKGIHLSAVISLVDGETGKEDPEIRAQIVLNGQEAKLDFHALESQKQHIEKSLEFPLTWLNPDDALMCRIFTRMKADFSNEDLWPDLFAWLKERMEKIHKVLEPIVKNLKHEVPA